MARLTVVALTALTSASVAGLVPAAATAASCTGSGPITTYLNWYDNASVGMVADNIHITNAGTGAASGCVTVGGGQGVPWAVDSGKGTYVTMPTGTYGGPVRVTVNAYTAGVAILASQRVRFHNSFNELPAVSPSQAATTSYFGWYDKASPGMLNDNIHLANPGTLDATVTVSLPGASPQTVMVGAGSENHVAFPQGTIGGPVTVTSTQPVLASQRVQFHSSFNEVWASTPAQAATVSYFNWFDRTSPGVAYDNIHLINPGPAVAKVTVGIDPCSVGDTFPIYPGHEAHFTLGWSYNRCVHFPPPCGVQCPLPMGGPVTVRSDQPLLASERVQFYSSFNEIPSAAASHGTTTLHFNWYDSASPGMYNDNIHLTDLGNMSAIVTITIGGPAPQTKTVVVGPDNYVNFPGQIGGPVTLTSTQPVLASQRVQYYQSFSETWSG